MSQSGKVEEIDETLRYVRAAPLVAITAHGLGPLNPGLPGHSSRQRFRTLRSSDFALMAALDTAGRVGNQILGLVGASGGAITAEAWARETADADPAELAIALDRLYAARLLEQDLVADGTLSLGVKLGDWWQNAQISLADQHVVTSDALSFMCRELGLKVPSRKQDRIDAIAALFADPAGRSGIRKGLSGPALDLLASIADRASIGAIGVDVFGFGSYSLHQVEPARSAFQRAPIRPELAPLYELTSRGIVGVSSYEDELWIWQEAWPLLERSLFPVWPRVATPEVCVRAEDGFRLPALMATVDQALMHWDGAPPVVLKSRELRLAKAVVRSTAKALGSTEEVIELISRLALSMGLLLPNTVSSSGRGRNRRVDEAWMLDPDVMQAWSALPLQGRWLRIVGEWARPSAVLSDQLLANRHLLLWELTSLAPETGWSDANEVSAWFGHHYHPVGSEEAIRQCLHELQALGVVSAEGPIGLTALGRLALEDPDQVASAPLGSAEQAVVQADHTIICPPDLDPTIAAHLERFAELESDAGARILRLSERLITRAVQNGDDPDSICAFLEKLSSVPLTDPVYRLVHDAAAQAGRVKVMSATTIVVVSDPADLATACSVKSAKLRAVAPMVAISALTPAKVQAALDRKGLSPMVVGGDTDLPMARRSSDEVAALEESARRARDVADRIGHAGFRSQAERMEEKAAEARDPSSRLAVTGPLALTPSLVRRLAGARDE